MIKILIWEVLVILSLEVVMDGVKIIMVTVWNDSKNFTQSFNEGCEGYVMKPIDKKNLYKTYVDQSV